jgi:hypothetical protein
MEGRKVVGRQNSPLSNVVGLCYSSVPAALQRFKRNSEAERGVDEDQEIPDNLASLLLTNTTLRPLRK